MRDPHDPTKRAVVRLRGLKGFGARAFYVAKLIASVPGVRVLVLCSGMRAALLFGRAVCEWLSNAFGCATVQRSEAHDTENAVFEVANSPGMPTPSRLTCVPATKRILRGRAGDVVLWDTAQLAYAGASEVMREFFLPLSMAGKMYSVRLQGTRHLMVVRSQAAREYVDTTRRRAPDAPPSVRLLPGAHWAPGVAPIGTAQGARDE